MHGRAAQPSAYVFICTEAGGVWSAKQSNDEKELSAEVSGDRMALEAELVKVVKEATGDKAFTFRHSQVTPTTTVFAATLGGAAPAAAAPAAASAGAAPAAAAEPEPEEEEESEEEDVDFDLFD